MSEVVLMCVLIVVARVADVSLGTVRTMVTIQGRRGLAIALSVVEVLIWVFVVSRVIQSLGTQPVYGLAYALGFALGTYIGMEIEQRLALGRQVVRVFTRLGPELAQALRNDGYGVTQFDGYGRDGPVQELFVAVERKRTRHIVARARALDPACYYMIDDIREASTAGADGARRAGHRK